MSKKKSLGSSPIGFHAQSSSLGFIPDLGISHSSTQSSHTVSREKEDDWLPIMSKDNHERELSHKTEKKIVSYNLEVDLVARVKSLADQKGLYYSSLVSQALKNWISENA